MELTRIIKAGGSRDRKQYIVRLEEEEREELRRLTATGRTGARTVRHAWVLLKAEACPTGPGWTDEQTDASGEFVAPMEDVLDVYTRPYDPRFPQVCMDEMSKQRVGETRVPIPAAPGRPARVDYEYERHGTSNLFLFVEPLRGWRHVRVTDRRTKQDWAHAVKELVDVHYPDAERIVLVLDNLNTHTRGALYETFPPAEARRLSRKLELHYTPKHGSWLNIAEIELSVLSRQCLNRRIAKHDQVTQEVSVWMHQRNARRQSVDWRFTTADARIKLKRLYPSL